MYFAKINWTNFGNREIISNILVKMPFQRGRVTYSQRDMHTTARKKEEKNILTNLQAAKIYMFFIVPDFSDEQE